MTFPLVLLALLALPASAQATTVSAIERDDDISGPVLEFKALAESGESNDLVVVGTRVGDTYSFAIEEQGDAPLIAGEGCAQANVARVECSGEFDSTLIDVGDQDDAVQTDLDPNVFAGVYLGPGDDEHVGSGEGAILVQGRSGNDIVDLSQMQPGPTPGLSNSADGGLGDDLLTGGESADFLTGRDGLDQLSGGGGRDHLSGSEERDALYGGAASDYLDGGSGRDTEVAGSGNDDFGGPDLGDDRQIGGEGDDHWFIFLDRRDGHDKVFGNSGADSITYQCRSCEVSLDDRANDGRQGEDDDVRVENVRLTSTTHGEIHDFNHGSGDDVIRGDEADNAIFSERGRDRISGGLGEDRISSGDGADRIRVADGRLDLVRCGTGIDSVRADQADDLHGCENVQIR